jgi:hypothetical protein
LLLTLLVACGPEGARTVRERALIHITGPKGVGKTTLIEGILGHSHELILAARCVRNDSARSARQTNPKAHPELRRYLDAGATDAAVFTFREDDIGSDAFFETPLMEGYSAAVLVEGDNPFGFIDLAVFVAPPPLPGRSMLVRRTRDRANEERQKADAMEHILRQPDGVAEFFGRLLGSSMVEAAQRRNPKLLEDTRADMLAGIARLRKAPPPPSTEHWAVAEGYEGIEQAQLVIVNLRNAAERERGELVLQELARIRKDEAVFADTLGPRGSRVPITAVVADLADPGDAGTKKALARIRRAIRPSS